MRTHAVLIVSATLLTGCWPARFVERPGVGGTVVSAQTHAPIAGAHVAVASDIHSERTEVVTTDANGISSRLPAQAGATAEQRFSKSSPLAVCWSPFMRKTSD